MNERVEWRVTRRKTRAKSEKTTAATFDARTLSHGMFGLVHGVIVFGKSMTMANSIKIPSKINQK
jgi:hypothetical protein